MSLPHSTPVPNIIFDSLIPHFTESELKVFLVIVRKTLGWFDKETGKRKGRDWIANSQFVQFTGLSKVSIWKSIESLSKRHYIQVTDINGNILSTAKGRHGKHKLFYEIDPLVLNYFHLTPKHFSFDS